MILINALGIQDSGGVHVLYKCLNELKSNATREEYIVFCYNTKEILSLIEKFRGKNFVFKTTKRKSLFYRFTYEFIKFKKISKQRKIKLIYNFNGSFNPLISIPQVVKFHNLLFFSKRIDRTYLKSYNFFPWVKDILLHRLILLFLYRRVKYFEVQSQHVVDSLSNYLKIKNRKFFIKSDIDITKNFLPPRKYNFKNKIKFLFVVGPHFRSPHKNLQVFFDSMLKLYGLGYKFEILITIEEESFKYFKTYEKLYKKIKFLGYISDRKKLLDLYQDNTFLVSSSIIETVGFHVIDAIKMGLITLVPNEQYATDVYGEDVFTYQFSGKNSLEKVVANILTGNFNLEKKILGAQKGLILRESRKIDNIKKVFTEVLNV